ncbi:hypothetical protein BJ684DRAFT_2566, partial [Piptocephalis cylindrospora]
LSNQEKEELFRQLSTSLDGLVQHGQEKLTVATQTYDMVDRHCRKLDDDLNRLEDEQFHG